MPLMDKDVVKIKITEDMLNVADEYAKDHIRADAKETPIFQTNEYKNKLVGYLGQVAFKKYLKLNGVIKDFTEVNMDGSPDLCDFKIFDLKIDTKTLTWNSYWEQESHPSWSIDIGSIETVSDLVDKFFFLVPQVQLNIDDFYNSYFNKRKKENEPKDVYWSLFIKKNKNNYVHSTVYIVGWCTHKDLLNADKNRSYFRFKKSYHTNIAIPLTKLNTNKSFFQKFANDG